MKKKLLTVLLATTLTFSLVACGNKADQNNSTTEQQVQIKDSLEILDTVWAEYSEDEKFPAAGGDFAEENMKDSAPGVFGVEDGDMIDYSLGYPATEIDRIDGAASIRHMMNVNTFTAGAYHVKDSADVATVAEAIKTNILARNWMCGFPDKLVVVSIGDYVVSFFGHEEPVDTFKEKLTTAYPTAEVISEDPIV